MAATNPLVARGLADVAKIALSPANASLDSFERLVRSIAACRAAIKADLTNSINNLNRALAQLLTQHPELLPWLETQRDEDE
jgi:hypothetical protein